MLNVNVKILRLIICLQIYAKFCNNYGLICNCRENKAYENQNSFQEEKKTTKETYEATMKTIIETQNKSLASAKTIEEKLQIMDGAAKAIASLNNAFYVK